MHKSIFMNANVPGYGTVWCIKAHAWINIQFKVLPRGLSKHFQGALKCFDKCSALLKLCRRLKYWQSTRKVCNSGCEAAIRLHTCCNKQRQKGDVFTVFLWVTRQLTLELQVSRQPIRQLRFKFKMMADPLRIRFLAFYSAVWHLCS